LEGAISFSGQEVKKTPFSKRAKKSNLVIDITERKKAIDVPTGSVFKGWEKRIRQDLDLRFL
jgi:hypothetical protein